MPLDEQQMQAESSPVPQAQTEGIARRLLGDDLVNRYGDVIGARKATAADVLRDFTIGFSQGREKVDELHMKVQKQFQTSYAKQEAAAIEAKKADSAKVKTVLEAIKTVQGLPPGHRASILKDTLDAAGISYSNAAVKLFTDSDLVSQLPMEKLAEAAGPDGALSTAEVSGVMGSGLNAAKFLSEVSRKNRDEQATQGLILNAERTKLRAKRDAVAAAVERKTAPFRVEGAKLSIENARLNAAVKEKALNTADKSSMLDRVLSGEGLGLPSPVDERTVEQPVAGAGLPAAHPVVPVDQDARAAAARNLGLTLTK